MTCFIWSDMIAPLFGGTTSRLDHSSARPVETHGGLTIPGGRASGREIKYGVTKKSS
jgi:hypothetical protein